MTPTQHRMEVEHRIRHEGNHHLIPIFTHVECIPERVHEYSNDLFIAYNSETEKFEVHSLENKDDSFCIELPYRRLDERTIRYIRRNDLKVVGIDAFRQRIKESREKQKRDKARQRSNDLRAIASEVRPAFAKAAWVM